MPSLFVISNKINLAEIVADKDIYGLILIGGKSLRMGSDKSRLKYHNLEQRQYLYELSSSIGLEAYFSCRQDQVAELSPDAPRIVDAYADIGPMAALMSAFEFKRNVAWFAMACDMPLISKDVLISLIQSRNKQKMATAFINNARNKPEPLITIWEPDSYQVLIANYRNKEYALQKVLMAMNINQVSTSKQDALLNANDMKTYHSLKNRLNKRSK